jgi:hypothetical protein
MIFVALGTLSLLPSYLCGGRYRIPAVPIKVMRCNARLALIFWQAKK